MLWRLLSQLNNLWLVVLASLANRHFYLLWPLWLYFQRLARCLLRLNILAPRSSSLLLHASLSSPFLLLLQPSLATSRLQNRQYELLGGVIYLNGEVVLLNWHYDYCKQDHEHAASYDYVDHCQVVLNLLFSINIFAASVSILHFYFLWRLIRVIRIEGRFMPSILISKWRVLFNLISTTHLPCLRKQLLKNIITGIPFSLVFVISTSCVLPAVYPGDALHLQLMFLYKILQGLLATPEVESCIFLHFLDFSITQ